MATEAVFYLLEELLQCEEREELMEAVQSARMGVAQVKRKRRSSKNLVHQSSFGEAGPQHPVCEGAVQFASARASALGMSEGRKKFKTPKIEDLRRRLLHEEGDSDNDSEAGAGPQHQQGRQALTASSELSIEELEAAESAYVFEDDETWAREVLAGRHAMELLWAQTPKTGNPRLRGSLVKTIRNEHWPTFVGQLAKVHAKKKQYFTPTSLPPRGCVGMRLFGRVWAQSCGIVLERAALDLPKDVWAWRSGFFAKTEFGVTSKTTADKTLRPDLEAALATLDELEHMAAAREYEHFGVKKTADEGIPVPYNEVFAAVKLEAIVAVFARTTQVQHILMAMGARDAMQRLIDEMMPDEGRPKRRIALLVLDANGTSPPKLLCPRAQAEILKRVSAPDQPYSFLSGSSPLPIDSRLWASRGIVTMHAVLCLHAGHAVSDDTLHDALARSCDDHDLPWLVCVEHRAEVALRRAVAPSRNNAFAAEAVVRVFGRLVANAHLSSSCDGAGSLYKDAADSTAAMLPSESVTDEACLRAGGALACLAALASGRLRWAAERAVDLLDGWLNKAEASLAFRVSSWRDASRHQPDDGNHGPSFAAFAGKKAINNRAKFRDKLKVGFAPSSLPQDDCDEQSDDPIIYPLAQLTDLVLSTHAPCLRLELLQFVVGLDSRWTRDLMLQSCELARDSLAAQNSTSPSLSSSQSDNNLAAVEHLVAQAQ